MVNYSVYGFVLNTGIGLNNYNAHKKIKQTNHMKKIIFFFYLNKKISRNNLFEDFFLIHIIYSTKQWHA